MVFLLEANGDKTDEVVVDDGLAENGISSDGGGGGAVFTGGGGAVFTGGGGGGADDVGGGDGESLRGGNDGMIGGGAGGAGVDLGGVGAILGGTEGTEGAGGADDVGGDFGMDGADGRGVELFGLAIPGIGIGGARFDIDDADLLREGIDGALGGCLGGGAAVLELFWLRVEAPLEVPSTT